MVEELWLGRLSLSRSLALLLSRSRSLSLSLTGEEEAFLFSFFTCTPPTLSGLALLRLVQSQRLGTLPLILSMPVTKETE